MKSKECFLPNGSYYSPRNLCSPVEEFGCVQSLVHHSSDYLTNYLSACSCLVMKFPVDLCLPVGLMLEELYRDGETSN